MNDSSRPPLPVSATSLLRYSVVAEVEAMVLGGWPAAAAVRHVAGADRVDLDGRPVRISVRTLRLPDLSQNQVTLLAADRRPTRRPA